MPDDGSTGDDAVGPSFDLPPSLWPALSRLAGYEWPPQTERDAASFVEAAVQQGLLALLLDEPDCPTPVSNALGRYRVWGQLFTRRAATLKRTVREIAALLSPDSFVLLKGADYAHRLYAKPALRPMQDVDILVPARRFEATCARLREAGHVQRFPGAPTHRVAWFSEAVFDLGDVTVEVHHSFLPRARHPIDYGAIFERRIPLGAAGIEADRLDDVDAFVYHTLSMAKDEFFVRLSRYVDLWLLLRRLPSLDAASQRAKEWGAARALYSALRQAADLFPEMDEGHVRVAAQGLSRRTREFLDRDVLPGIDGLRVTRARERGSQLWRKFWLLDSAWRRVCFAAAYGLAACQGRWLEWRAGRRGSTKLPPRRGNAALK